MATVSPDGDRDGREDQEESWLGVYPPPLNAEKGFDLNLELEYYRYLREAKDRLTSVRQVKEEIVHLFHIYVWRGAKLVDGSEGDYVRPDDLTQDSRPQLTLEHEYELSKYKMGIDNMEMNLDQGLLHLANLYAAYVKRDYSVRHKLRSFWGDIVPRRK